MQKKSQNSQKCIKKHRNFLGIFTRKLERTVVQIARKHGVNSEKNSKNAAKPKGKSPSPSLKGLDAQEPQDWSKRSNPRSNGQEWRELDRSWIGPVRWPIKGGERRFFSFAIALSLSNFSLLSLTSPLSSLRRFLEGDGRRRWRFIRIFINSAVNSRFRRALTSPENHESYINLLVSSP